MKNKWFTEYPTEPGIYWFYGELWRGSMGCHYGDNPEPIKPQIEYIEIHEDSGGCLIGTACESFLSSHKFNPNNHTEGWIGYWLKINEVEQPEDVLNLFN